MASMDPQTRNAPSGTDRRNNRNGDPRGAAPALIIAAAVTVLALPSAVLAFSSRFDLMPTGSAANQGLGGFAPGSPDPRLTRAMAHPPSGKGGLFRFTPAGLALRPDRLVTVVQRVDSGITRAIIVRGALVTPLTTPQAIPQVTASRIAPTAYTLGVARGYQGFSLPADKGGAADMPDLRSLQSADSGNGSGGGGGGFAPRLAPRITLSQHDRPGRAPRTFESGGEQSVDLGGSYRLTHNIDLNAGVRYSEDRDRLKPASDGKTDGQAVFVGTQFHF